MSDDVLARARDLYLSERQVEGSANPHVVASWQRSLDFEVDMRRLRAPYREDANLDVPLMRAARPVLDVLHQMLADEPIATMVTDAEGLILARDVSHAGITTRLNRVHLEPGHVFSENYVGTNGIGTALASGRGAMIKGAEHFVEELTTFHCTAFPIVHPTQRRLIGAFNLTASAEANSGRMALALAGSMAQRIEQEIGRISSQREYMLFERYMAACRGHRPVAILALNEEVTMMSERLRTIVTGPDQEVLLGHAREMLRDRHLAQRPSITLPSGRLIELLAVGSDDEEGGRVFQVRVVRAGEDVPGRPSTRPVLIPDLVGSVPSWVRAVSRLQAAYLARDSVAIVGEAGVGKVHAVTALHRASGARGSTVVLETPVGGDGEDGWLQAIEESLANPEHVVIVRNAHWMHDRLRSRLADVILGREPAGARLFVTMQPSEAVDELLALCDERVDLPPIRHRVEDLDRLIAFFARRYRPAGDLTLSPAAEGVLRRYAWPRNVGEVEALMRGLARRRSLRVVRVEDLPPECHVTAPNSLTVIEEGERDTIVRVLLAQSGNVHRAARELGIGRATIYRKMRRYGIDPSAF